MIKFCLTGLSLKRRVKLNFDVRRLRWNVPKCAYIEYPEWYFICSRLSRPFCGVDPGHPDQLEIERAVGSTRDALDDQFSTNSSQAKSKAKIDERKCEPVRNITLASGTTRPHASSTMILRYWRVLMQKSASLTLLPPTHTRRCRIF